MLHNSKYYYINLDHRLDRNDHILAQFKKFNISNYERINAIKEDFGPIGCTRSHIIALEKFIQSGDDTCFILEDDFEFVITPEEYADLLNKLEVSNIDWNIILLAANVLQAPGYNNFLRTCLNAQTTSGYMVNKNYANVLLSNYLEGLYLLIESKHTKYCIDRHWKYLQKPKSKWYIFMPKCGKQLCGFSDIEGKKVNYNC
jgi:GR25 family glycosyltransferase involved in LPS biosynthesis